MRCASTGIRSSNWSSRLPLVPVFRGTRSVYGRIVVKQRARAVCRCAVGMGTLLLVLTGAQTGAQSPPAELETIRGLVKSSREAMLSSQIAGRIVKLPFRDGAQFKEKAVLIAFDCALYRAELAAAKAERLARRKTWENNKSLNRLSAIGALEVEVSEAEHSKAAAKVRVAEVRVSRCAIRAPFDGRVVTTRVNQYESVGVNQELLAILDHRSLEIELIVPSGWLTWLNKGAEFTFTIDETAQTYAATVVRLAASADAVSQTVRVGAAFAGPVDNVIPGMSGTAAFQIRH